MERPTRLNLAQVVAQFLQRFLAARDFVEGRLGGVSIAD